jgi:hypothetical protein
MFCLCLNYHKAFASRQIARRLCISSAGEYCAIPKAAFFFLNPNRIFFLSFLRKQESRAERLTNAGLSAWRFLLSQE